MGRLGISFQSDKSIATYRALAERANDYDFATVSVYQDLMFQPPWPALLQFAERTHRPLVGPAVVNPYLSHPILVAGHLALIDEVSHGRAYLGVGRGAFFEALRMPQPRPLRAIREMVELTQRFLRGDDSPYVGEIFQATGDAVLRFPIPRRSLPVLIGGWGERTVRLAGEIADMVKIGGCANPESAPVFRARLDEGAQRAGRPQGATRLVYGAVTVIDKDRRIAEAIARRNVAMYVSAVGNLDPTYSPTQAELEAIRGHLASGDEAGAGEAISQETLRRYSTWGDASDIIARIEEMFDSGVDIYELGTPHGVDEGEAIRMLGEQVLPHFA